MNCCERSYGLLRAWLGYEPSETWKSAKYPIGDARQLARAFPRHRVHLYADSISKRADNVVYGGTVQELLDDEVAEPKNCLWLFTYKTEKGGSHIVIGEPAKAPGLEVIEAIAIETPLAKADWELDLAYIEELEARLDAVRERPEMAMVFASEKSFDEKVKIAVGKLEPGAEFDDLIQLVAEQGVRPDELSAWVEKAAAKLEKAEQEYIRKHEPPGPSRIVQQYRESPIFIPKGRE